MKRIRRFIAAFMLTVFDVDANELTVLQFTWQWIKAHLPRKNR